MSNIVLHLNNAIFALGSARRKLLDIKDTDIEPKLADISNQIQDVIAEVWGDDEYRFGGSQKADTGQTNPIPSPSPTDEVESPINGVQDVIDAPPTDEAFKKVDKLNFRDEWNGFKSIEPATIIGKHHLLTFNTNTRQLAIYVADANQTLDVKGSTLQNMTDNVNASFGKTLRKPESQLRTIMKSEPYAIDDRMGDIKAVAKPLTGRINKHVILLKTW